MKRLYYSFKSKTEFKDLPGVWFHHHVVDMTLFMNLQNYGRPLVLLDFDGTCQTLASVVWKSDKSRNIFWLRRLCGLVRISRLCPLQLNFDFLQTISLWPQTVSIVDFDKTCESFISQCGNLTTIRIFFNGTVLVRPVDFINSCPQLLLYFDLLTNLSVNPQTVTGFW